MAWEQELRDKKRQIGCMNVYCSKDSEILHFHHVQKHLKDGGVLLSSSTLERDIDELRKCIILCHKCHKQIHSKDYKKVIIHKHIEYCSTFLNKGFYLDKGERDKKNGNIVQRVFGDNWKKKRLERKKQRLINFRLGGKRKWCSFCDKHLLLNEFAINNDSRDGYHHKCNGCVAFCKKESYEKRRSREKKRIK